MQNSKFQIQNFKRGQSIVEALIVISIISTGVVGVVGMLSFSLSLNKEVSNQYVAIYLASEGVEVMRNLMDDNFKDEVAGNWDLSLDKCEIPIGNACGQFDNQGCAISYNDGAISASDANSALGKNNPANRNPLIFTNPYYVVNGAGTEVAGQTSFSRVVCVRRDPAGDANILEIESLVRWTGRGNRNHRYSLVDRFYNVPTKL